MTKKEILKKRLLLLLATAQIIAMTTGCGKEETLAKEVILEETVEEKIQTYETEVIVSNINNEEEVIKYFKERANSLEKYTENEAENFKRALTELIDFIFYGKDINGIMFEDLTESGKETIIDMFINVDEKIIEYYPNYKEENKKLYEDIKEKAKELPGQLKESITNVIDSGIIQDGVESAIDTFDTWYQKVR